VARLIVQEGLLKRGDFVVIGRALGRVRDIVNDRGQRIDEAGPSTPVAISGIDLLPEHVPGACEWELWHYDPALVPDCESVDPLSLTLSLQGHTDERVQLAIDELKGSFPW
jgi:hypothetical protein